jgi:hypothetical protein
MAISTPYKNNTVASVSGTTFNSNGTPFAVGDVGRLIVLTNGSGNLQHRKIVSFTDTNTVEVDHAWDATPWLKTVPDVNPSNGDAWAMSYLQSDATFTGDAGVTVVDNTIDISVLVLSGSAYVHIINAAVRLDSGGIEIRETAGMVFGWYKYIAGEDGQVRDSCVITDYTAETSGGDQMSGALGDFGMCDIYGGSIIRDNGSINFWRIYSDNVDTSVCQARLISVRTFGDGGLGSRVSGDRSILIIEQVGARTTIGVSNPRSSVSRVEITAVDCDQAAYAFLSVTSGGPSGRLVFTRLNAIALKVIRCNSSGHSGTNIMEVLGKKSEIDAAPVFIESSATPSGTHTFRYGNLILPSFFDTSAVKVTDDIRTVLKDVNDTIVNTETLTTGDYTEYFTRHSDITTVAGDLDISDGTLFAPYTLNSMSFGKAIQSQSLDLEDTFNSPLTLLVELQLTESVKATIDAYTGLETAAKIFDAFYSEEYDNHITNGKSALLFGRVGSQVDIGANNLIVDSAAASVRGITGTTGTAKAATLTEGATGTGTVTIQGATALNGGAFDCDITYTSSATTLTNVTCTGALDFTIAGTYTLIDCTINEVTNSSGGAVTLNMANGSVITTNTGPSITINAQVAIVNFENLTDATVEIFDGSGVSQQRYTAQTGTLAYQTPYGATGSWSYVIDRIGYEPKIATYLTTNGNVTVEGSLAQLLTVNGVVMYTATSSANITVTYDFVTPCLCIEIGNAIVSPQTIFDEVELSLVTPDGMKWQNTYQTLTRFAELPNLGASLFMEGNIRLKRSLAGDTNASISGYVSSTDGIVVNGVNGNVLYALGLTIAEVQAGLATEVNATSNKDSIITEVNANETKIDLIETKAQADARQVLVAKEATKFDPAVDVVANVTLVDVATANTDMRGTDSANTTAPDNAGITANGVAIAALNDFNPSLDAVANVTLVGTTTVNTDMVGTAGANTIVPDNAGIAANGVAIGNLNDVSEAQVKTQADQSLIDYKVDTLSNVKASVRA